MGGCCSKKKINPVRIIYLMNLLLSTQSTRKCSCHFIIQDDFDRINKALSFNEEIENIRVAVRVRQFISF